MKPLRAGSARKATASATSFGEAKRPIGFCPVMSASM
jgi:hypothetical protein